MSISTSELTNLAELAQLALNEAELERVKTELEQILNYMASLKELVDEPNSPTLAEPHDTLSPSSVEPTSEPRSLKALSALRSDTAEPSLPRDALLAAAPLTEAHHFSVPQVIEST